MDLLDALYSRRSVRQYSEKEVERPLLEKLLDAAVQAPSASNSQPWCFGVIKDFNRLKGYSDKAKSHVLSMLDPNLEHYRAMLSNPDFNIFYNAKTLIVIYAKPIGPHAEGDCCLAAQNLMLAAHDNGLGSCWIGFAVPLFNLPEIKAELKVPAEYVAVAPLIIGYPASKLLQMKKNKPEILFGD
jgi:nitroreductase